MFNMFCAKTCLQISPVNPSSARPSLFLWKQKIPKHFVESDYVEHDYVEPDYVEPDHVEPNCVEPFDGRWPEL